MLYHRSTNVNLYPWVCKYSVRSLRGVSFVGCFCMVYHSQWLIAWYHGVKASLSVQVHSHAVSISTNTELLQLHSLCTKYFVCEFLLFWNNLCLNSCSYLLNCFVGGFLWYLNITFVLLQSVWCNQANCGGRNFLFWYF